MDLLLTIFKFAGIVVGGVSGVLGTITKTHDEKTISPIIYGGEPTIERKLSRWGKISLSLTIVGALVAGGAQLAESWKKQQEDNDSRKRTERQIDQANDVLKRLEEQGIQTKSVLTNLHQQALLAQSSLDALGRITTRFERIVLHAVFEVPLTNNIALQHLQSQLHLIATNDAHRANLPAAIEVRVDSGSPPVLSPSRAVIIKMANLFDAAVLSNAPALGELRGFFEFLREPDIKVALNKMPIPLDASSPELMFGAPRSDLHLFAYTNTGQATLVYSTNSGRLFVRWEGIEFLKQKWVATGNIVGVTDLPGAQFLCTVNPPLVNHRQTTPPVVVKPKWIRVVFGSHLTDLRDFQSVFLRDRTTVFEAIMPAKHLIISDPYAFFPTTPLFY